MKSIDNFIFELESQQKIIVSYLHERLTTHHDLLSKISYGIPMYYRRSWICYTNPLKNGEVDFVFTHGKLLSNEQGLLDSSGRKQVAGIILRHISEIPERSIDEMIQEALMLDEVISYKKH